MGLDSQERSLIQAPRNLIICLQYQIACLKGIVMVAELNCGVVLRRDVTLVIAPTTALNATHSMIFGTKI